MSNVQPTARRTRLTLARATAGGTLRAVSETILVRVYEPDGEMGEQQLPVTSGALLARARVLIGGDLDLGSARHRQLEFVVGEWSMRDDPYNEAASLVLGRQAHGRVLIWGLDSGGGAVNFPVDVFG